MYIYYNDYKNEGVTKIEKINSEYGILFLGNGVYFNQKMFPYKDISVNRICDYIDEKWLAEGNVTIVE